MGFEWDEAKNAANLEKHGVDFLEASRIFGGPLVIVPAWSSEEERFKAIGAAGNRVWVVIYTQRLENRRIIGARKASRNERRQYSELFEH